MPLTTWTSIQDLISVLQGCRKQKSLISANLLHARICNNGLEIHRAIGNYVVPMLVACGGILDAQRVFHRLLHRNQHSWTCMILGYLQIGKSREALNLYNEMEDASVNPSRYTLMAALKACSRLKHTEMGREVHDEIVERGFERDLFVGSALVDMYAKCGLLSEARDVFDKLPAADVVSWNTLIAGYAEHGPGKEALRCFHQMQLVGICPNIITFVCILKACCRIRDLDKGREIHVQIAKKGYDKNLFIGSALVDMYAKCGSLLEAREAFSKLPVQDLVSWASLMAGYVEHGPAQGALKSFEQMQQEGIAPDAIIYVYVLKACGIVGDIDKGREIHAAITQGGFEKDLFVGSALVDMYAKCGYVSLAMDAFNRLQARNVVTWTALIAGFAEHGSAQEALQCFEQMKADGILPNSVTFICVLKACGRIGAINKGREIHNEISDNGVERDLFVASTLIDMYANCGSLAEAQEAFDKLPTKNVVSWNAIINGYGMNRQCNMAVQCFEAMQKHGVKPDTITFKCLLAACTRASMVLKGLEYFKWMQEENGVLPTIDHYTCMIDLLARSGCLNEAENLVRTIPYASSVETWTSVLNACKNYGEVELGLRCFEELIHMNSEDSSSYVLMAGIYASIDQKSGAYRIEDLRKQAGAKKMPASAFIEVGKKVHEFVVGNNTNKKLWAMLEILNMHLEEKEHVSNLDLVLRYSSDKEKELSLCQHAEKLAIAFGLLNLPHGQTLYITKNMRMCNNCHNASKTISRIEGREIIVRDSYCIHHFKNDLCSCMDVF